jgi:CRP/FNR family cyclic AMP-dependent transcriptional regulator
VTFASFFDYPGTEQAPAQNALVFLPDLRDEDWEKILAHTVTRRFSAGDMVIQIGEIDRALYIISEGTLETLIPHGNGRTMRRVNTIEAGSVIGEMAFFDGLPRSASVRALTDGEYLRLSYDAFEVLAAREPALARAILFDLGRILANRVREKDAFISALVR